jgi:hypothetical protein
MQQKATNLEDGTSYAFVHVVVATAVPDCVEVISLMV